MSEDQGRTFSISDGLMLIAGIAASFACVRATFPDDHFKSMSYPSDDLSWHVLPDLMEPAVIVGVPALVIWTPFCLLLQARKPRPPWRRLRKQPGFVANLFASAVIVLTVATVTGCDLLFSIQRQGSFVNRYETAYVALSMVCGAAMFWGWAGLWLSGSLRPDRSWRGWLGLANGAGWMAMGLLCAYFLYNKF